MIKRVRGIRATSRENREEQGPQDSHYWMTRTPRGSSLLWSNRTPSILYAFTAARPTQLLPYPFIRLP